MGIELNPDIPLLVQKCQSGNSHAFGELYDHFSGKIFRYLYFRVYQRDTAEDLTSITFMKAMEKLSQYRQDKGEFSAWLYRIARNSLFDYFRSRKKTVELEEAWELAGNTDIHADAEQKDQWERIQPFLRQLKQEQQEILKMRIWDEMSYKEIAEILGKNEAACKMTFSRTIRQLKEMMPLEVTLLLLLSVLF